MRIKGARAALAGWEPDILGLSMRWPFCQMMSRPDPQSSELGHRNRSNRNSQILWWGMCAGTESDIFLAAGGQPGEMKL